MEEFQRTLTIPEGPVPTSRLGNYLPDADVPDEEKWADCVHCGFCLQACPTYQELGQEHQSPRGRVYLIQAVAEGKAALDERFADPVFTCLDCRACETACPSNVQVGSLIEKARGQVRKAAPLKGWRGFLQKIFLNGIFEHPTRLYALGTVLRFLQKSGLETFARKLGLLKILPKHLRDMETILPAAAQPVKKTFGTVIPAEGVMKKRVGLLTGCIMDVLFSDVNAATIRVLAKNGYEVVIPEGQRCCGALHVHAGDREAGKRLAKQNIAAFRDVDTVIVNAAGCGLALQEYGELLEDDPVWKSEAEAFAAKAVDITKFLVDYGYRKPAAAIHKRVVYHDACHLAHGQGVRAEPRQILKDIPGIEWGDLPDSDRCCGSAGIYNLTHPEMAGRLLERKIDDMPEDVDLISMGNPGCMLQIAMGIERRGHRAKVVHTVQLLDWAYEREQSEERVPRV